MNQSFINQQCICSSRWSLLHKSDCFSRASLQTPGQKHYFTCMNKLYVTQTNEVHVVPEISPSVHLPLKTSNTNLKRWPQWGRHPAARRSRSAAAATARRRVDVWTAESSPRHPPRCSLEPKHTNKQKPQSQVESLSKQQDQFKPPEGLRWCDDLPSE